MRRPDSQGWLKDEIPLNWTTKGSQYGARSSRTQGLAFLPLVSSLLGVKSWWRAAVATDIGMRRRNVFPHRLIVEFLQTLRDTWTGCSTSGGCIRQEGNHCTNKFLRTAIMMRNNKKMAPSPFRSLNGTGVRRISQPRMMNVRKIATW